MRLETNLQEDVDIKYDSGVVTLQIWTGANWIEKQINLNELRSFVDAVEAIR